MGFLSGLFSGLGSGGGGLFDRGSLISGMLGGNADSGPDTFEEDEIELDRFPQQNDIGKPLPNSMENRMNQEGRSSQQPFNQHSGPQPLTQQAPQQPSIFEDKGFMPERRRFMQSGARHTRRPITPTKQSPIASIQQNPKAPAQQNPAAPLQQEPRREGLLNMAPKERTPEGIQPTSPEGPKPVFTPSSNIPSNLGSVSAKYESGGRGASTISSGRGDPGGVSYGTHQLASKTGTLQRFLKNSEYGPQFRGLRPGTPAFNSKWRQLAKDPKFGESQHNFIEKTHFNPVRGHADKLGIPQTPAINEALFSMGVQHGGAKKIIQRAGITKGMSEPQVINRLYDSREKYVRGIRMPSATRQSLLNRYRRERRDVLNMTKRV